MVLARVWLSTQAAVAVLGVVTTLLAGVVTVAVFVSVTREKVEQLERRLGRVEDEMGDLRLTVGALEERAFGREERGDANDPDGVKDLTQEDEKSDA